MPVDKDLICDRNSFIVAGAVFAATFLLFYQYTGEFAKCIGAALITAGLVWISYIVLRWMYLAIKS
jgi:hypothetical protein